MTGWGRVLLWCFGALAILPLAFALVSDLGSGGFGDAPGLLWAYLNSALLAAAAATLATFIATYLLFFARRTSEAAVFATFLFIIPGDFVAIGMTRFIRKLFGFPSELWRSVILIVVQVGYCFPFVLVALLGCALAMGGSRIQALHELSANRWVLLSSVARAYWAPFGLVWLLGFNLVVSEASRTTILAGDVFGLGRRFFAPEIASAFAAKGVDPMLFIISVLPLVPLAGLAIAVRQRVRAQRRG